MSKKSEEEKKKDVFSTITFPAKVRFRKGSFSAVEACYHRNGGPHWLHKAGDEADEYRRKRS